MSEAPLFAGVHDPSDIADYLIQFDDLLDTAETLVSQSVAIDTASAAVGLALGVGSYAPVAVSKAVRFWLTCSQPTNAAFAAGVLCVVTATVTTNGSPARTFQRSVLVRVSQSDRISAPFSLAEAKAHLRVIDDEENDYINGLIAAAAAKIEQDTIVILRARELEESFDRWQTDGRARLELRRRPITAIVSVQYDDAQGNEQTLASDQYKLRDFAGSTWLLPAAGVTWPEADGQIGCIRVTYTAGYASNDELPAGLRQAAYLLLGHWYENRESVNVGNIVSTVPMAYESLTDNFRNRWVA